MRGLGRFVGELDLPGAASIVRPSDRDMFRLGSEEARAEGVAAGYEAGLVEGRGLGYSDGYADGFAEADAEDA